MESAQEGNEQKSKKLPLKPEESGIDSLIKELRTLAERQLEILAATIQQAIGNPKDDQIKRLEKKLLSLESQIKVSQNKSEESPTDQI